MWSDKSVQEQVLKYVPLWSVTKTDPKLAAKYGVARGLALVVAGEPGKTLLVQRNMPFNSVEKAVAWFKGISAKTQAVTDAEKKVAENKDSREAKTALVDAYSAAGRLDDAIALLGEVAAKLETGSDERISLEFRRASLAKVKFDYELAGKLYEGVVPALLEKKDERAVEGAIEYAQILQMARKADKGRELLLKAVEAFPKHSRVTEMRYTAAICRMGMPKPDYDAIAEEMSKVAAEAPEGDEFGKRAKTLAEALKNRAKRARNTEEKPKEENKEGSGK